MTDQYVEAAADLRESLIEDGAAFTLTNEDITGGYDADGNEVAPGADATLTGYGLRVDYKPGLVDGTIVKSGDTRLLFSFDTDVSGLDLSGYGTTIGGKKYRVVLATDINPTGDTVIGYWLQLRR